MDPAQTLNHRGKIVVAAALSVAERPDMAGKTIVTFAPSSAEGYFSSDLFVDPSAKPAG